MYESKRTIDGLVVTADGKKLEENLKRITWAELEKHASFPKSQVKKREESITVPAGKFDCVVYEVKDPKSSETSTFFFAKTLPGAPVMVVTTTKSGETVTTRTLLEHKTGNVPVSESVG